MTADNHLVLLTKFVAAREKKPRWALFALKSEVAALLPENRVSICFHHRLPERENVEIWYNAELAKATYRGLMKCGQVWLCPVCAQRLAAIRRETLKTAIQNASDKFFPVMVTYTVQHHAGQSLSYLLDKMNAAYRRMRQQRLWRVYKEEWLIEGETRAVEITYGANGWHPHYHVILWLKLEILDYMKDDNGEYRIGNLQDGLFKHLAPLWVESLQAFQLTGLTDRALNIRPGWKELNEYMTKNGTILPDNGAKWGLAEEATMGQFKKAHEEGKTPWDLLIESFCGHAPSGELFKEYAASTKGKSSLQWTPGLKAALGVDIDEDKAICLDEENEADILLWTLDVEQWRAVVNTGAVGILLDKASTGDPEQVKALLIEVNRRNETENYNPIA